MDGKKISLLIIVILLVGTVAFLFMRYTNLPVAVSNDNVKRFNSFDEIKNFVKENSENAQVYNYGTAARGDIMAQEAGATKGSSEATAPSAGASEFSKTNIQVEGVDEPDIVKNDGKYIYVASGKKVEIAEAYPATEMKVLSEINLNSSIGNIFLNKDKLIIFSSDYRYFDTGRGCGDIYATGGMPIRCGGYTKYLTNVYIYDISDRENPELTENISIDGNYIDARMIDNYIYLISSKYVYLDFLEMPSYGVNGVTKTIQASDVYYFDYPDSNYNFNIVSAININNGDVNTKVFLMGYSSNIYVSQDNIYLTYAKQISPKVYYERFTDEVIIPVLPSKEADKVAEVMNSEETLHDKYESIGKIMQNYIESLDQEELSSFLQEYQNASEKFSEEIYKEIQKTVIQKISVNNDEIKYATTGEVSGNVLNQFSMDERDGYFRIATTTGSLWGSNQNSKNNLYVLDSDLKLVGKVEGLAVGERIYSVRFVSERAYMVTFRQVDPLFVIDLANPEQPKVLGYLKVTGYSSYLQSYDEAHLIGVGQEATAEGRVLGLKVSLFDVSDVNNPQEIGKYTLEGESWSSSEALYEHKAFLFDKEKSLLVMPVSSSGYANGAYEYWQGVYVFNVNLQDGVKLKGKITHDTPTNETDYYGKYRNIRRALYMDDVLYTISDGMIKANEIDDLQEINKIKWEVENYYVYSWTAQGSVAIE